MISIVDSATKGDLLGRWPNCTVGVLCEIILSPGFIKTLSEEMPFERKVFHPSCRLLDTFRTLEAVSIQAVLTLNG